MDNPCTCHAFGIYRGKVANVTDPEGLMRIKVIVPQLFGEDPIENWAWPCVPVGAILVPPLNGPVWVAFVGGDIDKPLWLGTWRTA